MEFTNNKRHVVFSTHPSSNNGTDETIKADWEKFKATVMINKERVDEYLKNVK